MDENVTRRGISLASTMVAVLNLFIGIVLCRQYQNAPLRSKLQEMCAIWGLHLEWGGGRGGGGGGRVYASTLKLVIHHRIHHCHVPQFGRIISHC